MNGSAAPQESPPPQPAAGATVTRLGREHDANSLILALQAHRKLPREEAGYWDHYCQLIKLLCRASAVLFAQRSNNAWQTLGQECGSDDWLPANWTASVDDLGERALKNGFAFLPVQDTANKRLHILAMVRATGLGDALLVLDIPERERAQLNELIMRALLATDFPEAAATAAAVSSANVALLDQAGGGKRGEDNLLDMLDLAAQVMNKAQFGGATLALVNGIAAHYGASQVALGWFRNEDMPVVAVSHVDRFERNTTNVRLLENAFLEAVGHGRELWWSAAGDEQRYLTAHAEVRNALGFADMCAIPVRDADGAVRALIFLAFKEAPDVLPSTDNLSLVMGFLQPWLQDLEERDRIWAARLATRTKKALGALTGPGNVWGKTFAVAVSALLLFVLFGTWNYRIEAMSQLTTDGTRIISAQFDGRVDEVHATAGDTVKAGTVLATLDTRDLRQQEMDIRAERQRLIAEADKARAAGNLAELEIAEARFAQSEARLARVMHYLGQATAVAPFDGVVVDGERKELLNAPVKKGDKLFRVARIDGLYIELLLPERDIRYVQQNAHGELRLLSRPDQKIPFTLTAFIPVAQVKGQEGNHFVVKARLEQTPEAWWRPGMSGIAHIDGGKQNVAWIMTHKLVDTLRMKLPWMWW